MSILSHVLPSGFPQPPALKPWSTGFQPPRAVEHGNGAAWRGAESRRAQSEPGDAAELPSQRDHGQVLLHGPPGASGRKNPLIAPGGPIQSILRLLPEQTDT